MNDQHALVAPYYKTTAAMTTDLYPWFSPFLHSKIIEMTKQKRFWSWDGNDWTPQWPTLPHPPRDRYPDFKGKSINPKQGITNCCTHTLSLNENLWRGETGKLLISNTGKQSWNNFNLRRPDHVQTRLEKKAIIGTKGGKSLPTRSHL